MKRIFDLLKSNKDIDRFRITKKERSSHEFFFVHEKLETARATDTADINVTVYIDHDGATGDSSFNVYRSMSDDDIAKKAEDAVSRAKLVFNKQYGFPNPGTLDAGISSNMSEYDPQKLGLDIAKAVFEAECSDGGSINATEVFVYRNVTHVVNSEGMDKKQTEYRAMIEVIPTFTENDESVELYYSSNYASFDSERITADVNRKMQEVEKRKHAVKPQTPIKCDVVLRENEIRELMMLIADDLSYSNVYSRSNLRSIGDELPTSDSGDKITIRMVGEIEGAVGSSYFDAEGTTLIPTLIINQSKIVSYYGSHRFAEYLGQKDTGALGCISVDAGTLTEDHLKAHDHLECISLSAMQVDLYSDYIGGEIRLAYLHKNGESIPVTGITMSGKLSEVLKTLRLSEEKITIGSYFGPNKLLIKEMNVI